MSWTRDEALTLRNKAAERAQRCAAVVRESEECLALVTRLDDVLLGVLTPYAEALGELAPVTGAAYVGNGNRAANGKVPSKVAKLHPVLVYLRLHDGVLFKTQELASALEISPSTVRSTLKRLHENGEIERPKRGLYCYRSGQLTA